MIVMLDKNSIFNDFKILPLIEDKKNEINLKSKPKQNIDNYIMWCLRFLDFIDFAKGMEKEYGDEFDYEDVVESGKIYINKKAYTYIKYIDYENKKHIKAIKKCDWKKLKYCIKFSLEHYTNMEEYLKCGFLKKILDSIENNLEK